MSKSSLGTDVEDQKPAVISGGKKECGGGVSSVCQECEEKEVGTALQQPVAEFA